MISPVFAYPEVGGSAPLREVGPALTPLRAVGDVRAEPTPEQIDRELAALVRERGPLRAVLARLASCMVWARGWEPLGYARLGDYSRERLGRSARFIQDLAQVGWRLRAPHPLENALVSGALGWTRARLLARLPPEEDAEAWIDHARRVTALELSKQIRAVDRGSVEAGALNDDAEKPGSGQFRARCTPAVRWKWHSAREAARRVAGHVVGPSEAAELVAAEVLSAIPIGADEEGACEETGASWERSVEAGHETQHGAHGAGNPEGQEGAAPTAAASGPPVRTKGAEMAPPLPCRPAYPPALQPLVVGLRYADAFELDERLRQALEMEQRLEARIGPLLSVVWSRGVARALGYQSRDAYARERLGMDPTRARALVRLERVVVQSKALARAYRAGALSWVKASVVAPLVSADPLGWFVADWVRWAERVTVRRLRDDVELALTLAAVDREAFLRDGGLPAEARGDREIGAGSEEEGPASARTGEGWSVGAVLGEQTEDREIGAASEGESPRRPEAVETESDIRGLMDQLAELIGDREIGAGPTERASSPDGAEPRDLWKKTAPTETCVAGFTGPTQVVALFRAVLCTVRRRLETETGRLPSEGEALGAMLDHALSSWDVDGRIAARHKVFDRDGWRCTAPGCSSMRNLHDHHIRFRSAQGSDELENRTALCAFHHLRGVHAGTVRCTGEAPARLRWEMGIRSGEPPLLVYRSGDVELASGPGGVVMRRPASAAAAGTPPGRTPGPGPAGTGSRV